MIRMTITSVRINYFPEDGKFEKELSHTHWGFAEWFVRRLKPIRESLRGPEAKGIDIVNFMLYEKPHPDLKLSEWQKRMNSFEYNIRFDFASLLNRAPMDNIEMLMTTFAETARTAPWPQVVAVGGALGEPLTLDERAELLPYLQWPRLVGNLATKPKKFDA